MRGIKKLTCPDCGHKGVFVPFVDRVTGEIVSEKYGICDRKNSCGYMCKPNTSEWIPLKKSKIKQVDTVEYDRISESHVLSSLIYSDSNFHTFLKSLSTKYSAEYINDICRRLYIGSIEYWDDKATVFWQIDADMEVRAGKVMLYNIETGKRIKEETDSGVRSKIAWLHKSDSSFDLKQCYFGEHQLWLMQNNARFYRSLRNPNEVNIVESEKTAVLATLVYPKYLWCATGALNMLSAERLAPFKGMKINLIPDKGKAFLEWKRIAEKCKDIFTIKLVEEVENSDLSEGDDFGDLILKNCKRSK